jgi:hypothetical protein
LRNTITKFSRIQWKFEIGKCSVRPVTWKSDHMSGATLRLIVVRNSNSREGASEEKTVL